MGLTRLFVGAPRLWDFASNAGSDADCRTGKSNSSSKRSCNKLYLLDQQANEGGYGVAHTQHW
jgi:hypothetical protein